MKTGELLGILLLGFLLVWGLVDYLAWKSGYQTLSRWAIKESKKRKHFAWGALIVILTFSIWLIFHLELPMIILGN